MFIYLHGQDLKERSLFNDYNSGLMLEGGRTFFENWVDMLNRTRDE